MFETTKRYVTALVAAALISGAIAACGGGGGPTTIDDNGSGDNGSGDNGGGDNGGGDNGGDDNGGDDNGGGDTPTDVNLSHITPGFMAAAGTVTIVAGESEVHGDIAFSCAAGGDDCVVMVMVQNGEVTATSTGGTVSATNSDAFNTRIRIKNTNEANSIYAATGHDSAGGSAPLVPRRVVTFGSGSDYVGLYASVAAPEGASGRTSRAIPWVNLAGEVHFDISINSGLSQSDLAPLAWLGRSFYTTDISDYSEDSDHGLGNNWKVFDAEHNYDGTGSLTIRVATDVHDAGTVTRPWVGYGDFDQSIVLSQDDVPALPADRDWQGVNVAGGVTGSMDGVSGRFSCESGISQCWLETWRDGNADGYYPYPGVVFTRDGNVASELLSAVTSSQTVPTADYLVFGTWQYVPDDITAGDKYEFGVFAGGGDPFRSDDAAARLYGTATYNGSAHGMYFTGRSSNSPAVGSFDALVTLEADFGNMANTLDYGRLSGTVDNIRYSGSAQGFPAQLTLGGDDALEADIDGLFIDTNSEEIGAVGFVTDGQPTPSWSGTWQATFFGNDPVPSDHPSGVAGTFGATNVTDGLVGAFGARRQP